MAQRIGFSKGLQSVIKYQSFRAREDIIKRRAVKLSSAEKEIDQVDAVNDTAIGIAQTSTDKDDIVNVAMLVPGSTIACEAGGAFNDNVAIYLTANGRVDDVSGGSATRIGTSLDTAGAAGDLVQILIT